MRKLLSLLTIFAIVLSCSSDETSTPVTPPPVPIAKYTITLSAGEGGTVSTTGGEYESGQTVSVTATPQGEYLFKDWSDGNTDATRTITVNSNSSLTANFEKRKYPLTVNFEGEGEVIEEIVNAGRTTDYDSGTTVKLTAVPAEGWEFVGWTGALESNELEVQLLVSESKTISATFKASSIFSISKLKISDLISESKLSDFYLDAALSSVFMRSVYISDSDSEYIVIPGNAKCLEDENDPCENINGSLDTEMMPALVLKKDQNNEWKFFDIDGEGSMYMARNNRIKGNEFIFSDGNELGSNPGNWVGPIIYGKIENGSLTIKKATEINNYGYYHDADFGDLNNDGLIDIVGTRIQDDKPSGGSRPAAHLGILIQNSSEKFELKNSLIEYPSLENGERLFREMPLSVGVVDLNKDNISEIITYQGNFSFRTDSIGEIDLMNNPIVVWEYDKSKEKFIANFNDQNIHEINNIPNYRYEYGDYTKRYIDYSGTSQKFSDFNNDGFIDMAIAFEGREVGFEVWFGKDDNKFEFKFRKTYPQVEIPGQMGRYPNEFRLFDVNNDGLDDIVLITNQLHLVNFLPNSIRPNTNDWNDRKEGSELSNLIWINNGNGNFSKYPSEIRVDGFYPNSVIPYMKDGKLHFVGVNPHQEPLGRNLRQLKNGNVGPDDYYDPEEFEYIIFDIELNIN